MKKFIEQNFTVIICCLFLLITLKSCRDSQNLSQIKSEINSIKNNTYTKDELSVELKISGLEAEKRMIQSTNRSIMDVRRQTEIDEEIKKLRNK